MWSRREREHRERGLPAGESKRELMCCVDKRWFGRYARECIIMPVDERIYLPVLFPPIHNRDS